MEGWRRRQRTRSDRKIRDQSAALLHETFGSAVADVTMAKSRKSGKLIVKNVDLKIAGAFYSPADILAKHFAEALKRANRVSPVRLYPERTGEVRNLADAAAQLRSIAAIFVKKYRFVSHPLQVFYASLRKRELTPDECHEIVGYVSRLGKEQKDQAMLEWLNVLENGGEEARGITRDDEDDCGGGEAEAGGSDGEPGTEDE